MDFRDSQLCGDGFRCRGLVSRQHHRSGDSESAETVECGGSFLTKSVAEHNMASELLINGDVDDGFTRGHRIVSCASVDAGDKSRFPNVHRVTIDLRTYAVGRYFTRVSGFEEAEPAVMGFSHNRRGEHVGRILLCAGDEEEEVIHAPGCVRQHDISHLGFAVGEGSRLIESNRAYF